MKLHRTLNKRYYFIWNQKNFLLLCLFAKTDTESESSAISDPLDTIYKLNHCMKMIKTNNRKYSTMCFCALFRLFSEVHCFSFVHLIIVFSFPTFNLQQERKTWRSFIKLIEKSLLWLLFKENVISIKFISNLLCKWFDEIQLCVLLSFR